MTHERRLTPWLLVLPALAWLLVPLVRIERIEAAARRDREPLRVDT